MREIKVLQTSFSRGSDLTIVGDLFKAIDALEELIILNYELDISQLWPAIFHHGASLSRLVIHTPPQMELDTWTPTVVQQILEKLPRLKRVELDVSLEEAERRLKKDSPFKQQTPSVLSELARLNQLESVTVNVTLQDAASAFAEQHTWNTMGAISFPSVNKEICTRLAEQIFASFYANSEKSSLTHLELRFPRRHWDDRCQYWTLAYSVHVKKEEGEVKVIEEKHWKPYLESWP